MKLTMTFWPRLLGAVICWVITMLALTTIAAHYLEPAPVDVSLGVKLLVVLAAGIVCTVVLLAVLAFWLWLWIRKY